METVEVTSMSSRGQVVIPQTIREDLGLREGEKFIVRGKDDTIVLKKIRQTSFEEFEKMVAETRRFAKEKGVTKKDLEEAITRVRKGRS
ncbi:MAG TPA: AbrB/MazE/SpoVT family DNA-binding domain-containing protein [Candidatus Nanoarchaeia archaeon]|nr:AbrB/MazE/SpoVT family DNA-binding domain-containing protein [Candidatus Nanoarchaeia archaeon]